MTKRSRPIVAVFAASMLVVACGDGSDESRIGEPSVPPGPSFTDGSVSDDAGATTATSAATTTVTTAPAAESVETLVVWADAPRAQPLRAASVEFAESTGVAVLVEVVPIESMRERVERDIPTGDGPDIFVGPHDWSGDLAARELIAPIDVDAERVEFLEVAIDAFNLGGQTYAVPYSTEAVALYRNTAMVAEPPSTWDELLVACDRVRVANCLVVPGGAEWSDAYHNFPFVSAFGGDVFGFDESTGFDPSSVGLDSAEAVRGVEFLEEQVAAGTIPATHYDSAKQLFLDGEAAFWISGPWELDELRAQDVVAFDVSLLPRITDGPMRPFVRADGFFLSAFSERPVIANDFLLDHVATDETMRRLFDADVLGTAWRSLRGGSPGSPHTDVFVESAANGVPMPNIPEMGAVWGPLGDNLQLVRNGELSADAAMRATADEVRTTLAE